MKLWPHWGTVLERVGGLNIVCHGAGMRGGWTEGLFSVSLLQNRNDGGGLMERSGQGSLCAKCSGYLCYPKIPLGQELPSLEKAPGYCPMRRHPEILAGAAGEYARPEVREFARLASVQEGRCYELTTEGLRTIFSRIEETMQFAKRCGYARLGLAFCTGLREEAGMLSSIFENNGFEVVSVNCKVGRIDKEAIGLQAAEKITPPLIEPICNPIAQAEIINAEQVDLAVLLGLCVGHDTLFFRYCRVPCTVLAVKDRLLGHNPLAALYLSKSPYYSRLNMAGSEAPAGKKIRL